MGVIELVFEGRGFEIFFLQTLNIKNRRADLRQIFRACGPQAPGLRFKPEVGEGSNLGLTEIAGLDNGGPDIDGRIWATDCNQLKIGLTVERFYQLTGTITVLKASYVLRHMKFTYISKNYEHAMSIT